MPGQEQFKPKPKGIENLVFTDTVGLFMILQANCGGSGVGGDRQRRRGKQTIMGNLLSEVKGHELDLVTDGSQ